MDTFLAFFIHATVGRVLAIAISVTLVVMASVAVRNTVNTVYSRLVRMGWDRLIRWSQKAGGAVAAYRKAPRVVYSALLGQYLDQEEAVEQEARTIGLGFWGKLKAILQMRKEYRLSWVEVFTQKKLGLPSDKHYDAQTEEELGRGMSFDELYEEEHSAYYADEVLGETPETFVGSICNEGEEEAEYCDGCKLHHGERAPWCEECDKHHWGECYHRCPTCKRWEDDCECIPMEGRGWSFTGDWKTLDRDAGFLAGYTDMVPFGTLPPARLWVKRPEVRLAARREALPFGIIEHSGKLYGQVCKRYEQLKYERSGRAARRLGRSISPD